MLPLLRTKTTIPRTRPQQVERSRLLQRVAAGARRALTLIVAPAGFGKTTLAATWAGEAKMPVAWLSLQPTDRPRFLSYLIQALQSVAPQVGGTTLALLQGGSSEGALYALANDLAGLEGEAALVLDDYHCVDSPETGEVVQFLLENCPDSFHLLLTSRVAPTLSLTRLRARDQVVEIGAADLRFTAAEVRAFLETCMDLHLSVEDLARLNQSTEGWPVGLQLAALALARHAAGWKLLAGEEHIFDYLAEEVLQREPPAVQDFLRISALFDRFCAPFCARLLSSSEAEVRDILTYIERANLFLVHLDTAWFRYHALFGDFLRRQVSEVQALALYRSASRWFEENGLLDDAIHYAIHAADFERAAGLLESHYIDMLQRGEQSAISEWVGAMPLELFERRPRLWLARGWASAIAFNTVQARACAERAEALLPGSENEDRLRGEAKSLRILAGIFAGETSPEVEISSTFTALAEQDDFLHSLLHFNLGMYNVMRGETSKAVEALTETLRLAGAPGSPLIVISAQVQLGETRQMRGALGLAERAFQQAIRFTTQTLGERSFLLGLPYISYADLLREQNRFAEALHYVEQGITYCQVWQPVTSMDGYIALARLLAAQGNWAEAYQRLEEALKLAETSASVLDDTFVAIHLARLALLQGDLSRAARCIRTYNLEEASQGMYYAIGEIAQLALLRARVAGLAADPGPARPVIEALSALMLQSERRERVTPVLEALPLRARAHYALGQQAEAAEDLSHALALGAQSGYVRIFLDEGRELLRLLQDCRAEIHAPRSYLDQIIGLLGREVDGTPSSAEAAARPASFSAGLTPLTRRELDILTLLAAGKSNQEIAEERVLTLNTVKKHVANILSKLGVANRTQAVILARKLGWIE